MADLQQQSSVEGADQIRTGVSGVRPLLQGKTRTEAVALVWVEGTGSAARGLSTYANATDASRARQREDVQATEQAV